MAELFILALLGHLVGDYILQSQWMAFTKSKKGVQGILACTIHVLIYTASVALFLKTTNLLILGLIFIPHWIIDRWSLGELWLRLIKGRTYKEILTLEPGLERDFKIAFYAPVYMVVDNTLHILSLWLVIVLLMV